MNELKSLDDFELVQEYVNQAVWNWFDASTDEMGIAAGFHRLAARCLLLELRERGIDEPTEDMIFHHARKMIPRDDLRLC